MGSQSSNQETSTLPWTKMHILAPIILFLKHEKRTLKREKYALGEDIACSLR